MPIAWAVERWHGLSVRLANAPPTGNTAPPTGNPVCLILVAWQAHPTCPLIVAGNRDEFYVRPTQAIHRWDDGSGIVAGRDLTSGGTWLGVTRTGRFAAVTNVRDETAGTASPKTRGALPTEFLDSAESPRDYATGIDGALFTGFNLLACDLNELWWASNRADVPAARVEPGIHGLSNAQLDTPWPKVRNGTRAFADAVAADPGAPGDNIDAYFELLHRSDPAPDGELPDTGVGYDREKELSPLFVRTTGYGTRASTVLRVRPDGSFDITERTFDFSARTGENRIEEQ